MREMVGGSRRMGEGGEGGRERKQILPQCLLMKPTPKTGSMALFPATECAHRPQPPQYTYIYHSLAVYVQYMVAGESGSGESGSGESGSGDVRSSPQSPF